MRRQQRATGGSAVHHFKGKDYQTSTLRLRPTVFIISPPSWVEVLAVAVSGASRHARITHLCVVSSRVCLSATFSRTSIVITDSTSTAFDCGSPVVQKKPTSTRATAFQAPDIKRRKTSHSMNHASLTWSCGAYGVGTRKDKLCRRVRPFNPSGGPWNGKL